MPSNTMFEEAKGSRLGATSPHKKTAQKEGKFHQKEEQSQQEWRKALNRPEVLERAFIIFLSEHRSFCGRYNSATDFAHADPDVAFIFKERALTEMREHEREVNPGPLAKKYKDRRIEIQAAQRKGRARFVVERERQRQKEWERKLRVQAKVFAAKMAEAERARLERERAEEARQRVLDQNEAQKRRHDEERGKVKSRLVKQGDFDWYDNDLELPTADGTVVGMKKSLWKRLKHCLRSR